MKLNYSQKQPARSQWLGWLLLVIGTLMLIRTGITVLKLWQAGDRVQEAQRELDEARQENVRLKGQLAVVNSPEFVEKEAREKLGYGRPGEEVVVLPKTEVGFSPTPIPKEANWQKWKKLYWGG